MAKFTALASKVVSDSLAFSGVLLGSVAPLRHQFLLPRCSLARATTATAPAWCNWRLHRSGSSNSQSPGLERCQDLEGDHLTCINIQYLTWSRLEGYFLARGHIMYRPILHGVHTIHRTRLFFDRPRFVVYHCHFLNTCSNGYNVLKKCTPVGS